MQTYVHPSPRVQATCAAPAQRAREGNPASVDTAIQREKLAQAIGILDETGIDCWLTFARESSETPDPALELILGQDAPEPPPQVTTAMHACVDAIEAARNVLRAGVPGYQVDAVARQHSVAAGLPEYKHALGHSVGLATHDGGPLIGPRWPRYGEAPERPIELGSVYTLELGTPTERGYIVLEDEVLVTAQGADFISTVQRELMYAG